MNPNHVTGRYLAACGVPGNELSDIVGESPELQELFVRANQPLLSRPLFTPAAQVNRFAQDAIGIFHLLTSLPDRLFGGDLVLYCDALAIGQREAELMLRLADRVPPLYGRADMYDDGDQFWLLEFNLGSELGGIERAGEIPKAFQRCRQFAEFAGSTGLDYVDTGKKVADALRDAAAGIDVYNNPVVALIDAPDSLAAYGAHWNSLRQVMQGHGLTFLVGEINGLTYQRGKPMLDGRPVDVVLRCCSVAEMAAEANGMELMEPLMRAHETGAAVIWTPMASTLFANKGCLALLHEPRYQDLFTAREHDLIGRVVPPTYSLRIKDPFELHERLSHCVARQDELILKPNDAYGAKGIVPGWSTDAQTWRAALDAAAGNGWIVQQRVRPRPEPVLMGDAREAVPCEAAWGMFFTPQGCAGSYARVLPAGAPLIGLGADKRTQTAGAFTF
jgi:hypothetical protein